MKSKVMPVLSMYVGFISGILALVWIVFIGIKGCNNDKPSCGLRDGKIYSAVTYIDRNIGIKQDIQLDIDVKDCKVVGIETPNQYFGTYYFKPVVIKDKKATVVINHMTFRIYLGQ